MNREILKKAFIKSLPVLCSYIFVGTAYGIMMESAGFKWYMSLLVSEAVYTGAFQFVLITFLSSGASLITIALTAILMNSRQTFYSLAYLDEFKQMGKKKWYMVNTMTDETFAVNTTLENVPDKEERHSIMFLVAIFSKSYWLIGSVIGGILGQLIPFELKGIDFCMTALFVIIFLDRGENAKSHKPALMGLGVGVLCLFIFGSSAFMLPALLITSGLLVLFCGKESEKV